LLIFRDILIKESDGIFNYSQCFTSLFPASLFLIKNHWKGKSKMSKQIHSSVDTYVKQPSKATTILNTAVIAGFSGIAIFCVIATATFDKRVNTVDNKVDNGQILKPNESQAILKEVRSKLKTYYKSAENSFTDGKADMYAMRDVEHLRVNYNNSYSQQQNYLNQENLAYYCKYNADDKNCGRKANPLQLVQNAYHEPKKHVKTPNNPFSWQAKKAPPALKKPKQEHDGIGSIVAENNLKNVIKAGY